MIKETEWYKIHFTSWVGFCLAWWVPGQKVEIEITDQLGGLIQVLKPSEGQTEMEWTTELVSGSICYYRLLIDDQEVDNGQIIINK